MVSSTAFIEKAKEKNFSGILLQIGSGKDFLGNSDVFDREDKEAEQSDFIVKSYRYKDTLKDDIKGASLVISHAGAGTIQECLELKKNVIVVVNDTLMETHQIELAEKVRDLNVISLVKRSVLNLPFLPFF